MLLKRIKVETADVEHGMFIAQLDRPWLETPFFFQEFEIKDDEEVALLRKFCKHVYVDVTRGSLDEARVLEAHKHARSKSNRDPFSTSASSSRVGKEPSLKWKIIAALSRIDPTGRIASKFDGRQRYRNQTTVREEAAPAIEAYDVALHCMGEILADVREGKGISVDKLRIAVTPLIESIVRNPDAMAWLVTLRKHDNYRFRRAIATAAWAVILGRHLGFESRGLNTLAMGGILLNIGKAKIPESILTKSSPLSEAEEAVMRRHIEFGVAIAEKMPGINDDVIAMIRHHHERHDGSGYPDELSGVDIPVFGRIAGLVDCYDAMTANRSYAPAKSAYDAVRELNQLSGTLFQQQLVEQFVQAIGMFPTGSLVEFNTGEVGIVVEQHPERRLRPRVMVLLDGEKRRLDSPKNIDLIKLPSTAAEKNGRWIVQGFESGAFGIDPADYFMTAG